MVEEAKRSGALLTVPRVAGLLIGVFLPVLAVSSLVQKSGTVDETPHLAAGYSYLVMRDFRMNPEHPPLWKAIAAAPLLLVDPLLREDSLTWIQGNEWGFGVQFLHMWNDTERLLLLGRLPGVLLTMALAWALFAWSRSLFGARGGLLTLTLLVFDPNILAHARLVTTDVPFTAGLVFSLWSCARVFERVSAGRIAALCAAIAFTALVKFSAVLLVPMLAVLAILRVLGGGPWPVQGGRELLTRAHKAALALGLTALISLTSYGAVWAAYGFRFSVAPPGVTPPTLWKELPQDGPLDAVLRKLHDERIFPEAVLRGVSYFAHSHDGDVYYLLGERSAEGFAAYFPVAFLVKTPLAVLILLAWLLVRRRGPRGPPLLQEACWLVPLVLYAAVTLCVSYNLGHRHLLPVYPLLYVGLGRLARLPSGRRRRAYRAGLAGVVALLITTTLLQHPHYLPFFNRLVGGSRGGYKILADSNLDWGQDLEGLAPALAERGANEVNLAYFGTARAATYLKGVRVRSIYEIDPVPVRKGTYAISANMLVGLFLRPGVEDSFRIFRLALESPQHVDGLRIECVGNVGYSIYLFEVTAS